MIAGYDAKAGDLRSRRANQAGPRGRLFYARYNRGMALLCLPAQVSEDSNGGGVWWVVFAALGSMAICWFILSLIKDKKTNSLWKDENTEMDSTSDPYVGG
jgi:hypothetical protein